MITYSDLSQALYQFWTMFTLDGKPVPVWKTGHVPEDETIAPFPYITFDVSQADFSRPVTLFAFAWLKQKNGQNVNQQRATLADEVAAAIPTSGIRVFTESGMITIRRNEKLFVQDYETNEETEGEPIVGLRISYVITTY